jgi:CYTH domain-containing protein/CHAD domain-containing protein
MSKETEHRFLVHSDGWQKLAGPGAEMRQGYLSTDSKRNVRVRIASNESQITIKGKAKGLTRPEFEYSIPLRDGEEIEQLCLKPIVEKVRYKLQQGNLTWEIDEYAGENRGLVIAEVETKGGLGRLPSWVGPEISTDERYRNYNLVEHPFTSWGQDVPKPDTNYSFASGERLADTLCRVLKEQIATAVNELSNESGPVDRAIHEARKCVKRARSALRLIRPAIPDRFAEENLRLQQIGRTLSAFRDAQALIETLTDLEQKGAKSGRTNPDAKREFKNAFDRLKSRKKKLNDAPRAKAQIRSATRALRESLESLGNLPLDGIDFSVLTDSFETTLKRGRKACSQAYSQPVAANFHEFRKRAKDLRHQLAVLMELWPEVLSGYGKSAKSLEQYLGEDHNLAVLTDVLNGNGRRQNAFKVITSSVEKEQGKRRQKARLLAGRLYAESPKVWRARLNASWQAWQTETRSAH